MDDLLREFLTETNESPDTVDNQLVRFGAAETVVALTSVFKPYPERRGLYRHNAARAIPVKMPSFGLSASRAARGAL